MTALVTGGGERWRDRKGERRSYGREREKALPEEDSAGVTVGESADITGEGEPREPGEPGSQGRVAAPANPLPEGTTTTSQISSCPASVRHEDKIVNFIKCCGWVAVILN